MNVWESTVPATTGYVRVARPGRRRERTITRVGSPILPGRTAEAITPIIVARATGASGMGVRGRAARRTARQESARRKSESIIRANAATIQPGLAEIKAFAMWGRFRRLTANTSRAAKTKPRATSRTRRAIRCLLVVAHM